MRVFSSGRSGLWSRVRSLTLQGPAAFLGLMPMTPRESPTCATSSRCCGREITRVAVVPLVRESMVGKRKGLAFLAPPPPPLLAATASEKPGLTISVDKDARNPCKSLKAEMRDSLHQSVAMLAANELLEASCGFGPSTPVAGFGLTLPTAPDTPVPVPMPSAPTASWAPDCAFACAASWAFAAIARALRAILGSRSTQMLETSCPDSP
mmetsp:Transcript_49080/g.104471  ORF Transcript_49080/g.104471 Transcript_49080/m.104471 type:complete len:209 (-) Transcript_49080:342-968(-)